MRRTAATERRAAGMATEKMERVSRGRPCPICGHDDWCLVALDGSVAICPRTKEGSQKKCGEAGYLHILNDRHNGHDRHRSGARWRHRVTIGHDQGGPAQDFDQMSTRCQSQLTDDRRQALACSLGLSGRSLQRLRVGWDGRAYTFPMSDDCGRIIGIRRRFPSGSKVSVKGARNGLFIPTDLGEAGLLLVCEGPTDTAAALDLGFAAIGRPNCNSLVEMTVRAVRGREEIVIVADNDAVGRMGAERLASVLTLCCPCVRVVHPPDAVKDLRQWFNADLTCEALRTIIAETCPIHMKVSFSLLQAGKGALQ
jgi:hypothetical protein